MNKISLKLFLIFFTLIFFSLSNTIKSYAGQGNPYKKIIFFGDSLSDNGNLYWYDFGYMPKSPPYFQGRFTNGYVWSEHVAKYFYNKKYMSSANYAIGGETAIFHGPVDGYLPYSLSVSISNYLLHTVLSDRSTTLFVIWIGANDYLPDSTYTHENLTTNVVESIKYAVENLIYHGGMNFLVINLPDLSKTPRARAESSVERVKILTDMHNDKLKTAIQTLQEEYKQINIHLFDIHVLFDALMSQIKFSNTIPRIKNTTTSCWDGGYWISKHSKEESTNIITQQIEDYLQKKSKSLTKRNIAITRFESKGFARFISSSPDLLEAYYVGQAAEEGVKPCDNPNEYLYWDRVHPTAIVHTMVARKVIDFINENYEPI